MEMPVVGSARSGYQGSTGTNWSQAVPVSVERISIVQEPVSPPGTTVAGRAMRSRRTPAVAE